MEMETVAFMGLTTSIVATACCRQNKSHCVSSSAKTLGGCDIGHIDEEAALRMKPMVYTINNINIPSKCLCYNTPAAARLRLPVALGLICPPASHQLISS